MEKPENGFKIPRDLNPAGFNYEPASLPWLSSLLQRSSSLPSPLLSKTGQGNTSGHLPRRNFKGWGSNRTSVDSLVEFAIPWKAAKMLSIISISISGEIHYHWCLMDNLGLLMVGDFWSASLTWRSYASLLGSPAFWVAAPKLWNSLPQHVLSANSLEISELDYRNTPSIWPGLSTIDCHLLVWPDNLDLTWTLNYFDLVCHKLMLLWIMKWGYRSSRFD